jgi:PKD repeat protein
VILAVLMAIGLFAPAALQAATPVTAGYRDQSYADAPGGDDVTAAALQSKLWFNDGRWFALMFDPVTTPNAKFRIYRFDMTTQDWTSTSTPVDDRNRSHADVLSVGSTIYVASAHATSSLRFYRFTYAAATHAYTLAAGPITIANTTTGTGYSTIARAADGKLWIVFTQGLRVKFTVSADNGATWTTPADVPGQTSDLVAEDIAAVTSVSDGTRTGVEVLWDNQNPADQAFYSSIHLDSDAAGTWQSVETVLGNPGTTTYSADNHLNLKTASDGQPVAAIKTGKDADPSPNAGDPLVAVVKRTGNLNAAGTWTTHTVTTVGVKGTRPILQLDDQNSEAHVFLVDPTLASDGQQSVYERTAPIGTLNFGTASLGEAVIKSATDLAINDPTSTKQAATASSGVLVLAANIPTLRYLHACLGGPCPAPPVANFSTDTTSGPAPLTVQFTDTSTNSPTSWSWDFGDGSAASTVANPSHVYAAPGTYSVTLTATNAAGSDGVTKTDLITVSAPPATAFFPITPVRAIDTRTGSYHVGSMTTLVANVTQTGQIGGRVDLPTIPSDAIAVTGNLAVTGQTKAGYLAIGPDAATVGATSSLNFPVVDVRAYGVTIPLNDGSDGTLSFVYKAATGAKVDVVLDVTGYFRKTSATGATYHDVAPTRFLDTRSGLGLSGPFKANTSRTFDVVDRPDVTGVDIPVEATAVTGNLAVVGQTGAGYVSLGPDPASLGQTSTLNFPLGDIRANNVTVKLGAGGTLSALYTAGAGRTTQLVLDITGYFTEDGSGARYVAVQPARVLDTRPGGTGISGPFHSNVARTWTVGNVGGIDPNAVAVIGNVAVVGQTGAGYVAVTPVATANPSTSTINFPVGDIRANGMTVRLGAVGTLSATYKAGGTDTTHLVYDVFGYYK